MARKYNNKNKITIIIMMIDLIKGGGDTKRYI